MRTAPTTPACAATTIAGHARQAWPQRGRPLCSMHDPARHWRRAGYPSPARYAQHVARLSAGRARLRAQRSA